MAGGEAATGFPGIPVRPERLLHLSVKEGYYLVSENQIIDSDFGDLEGGFIPGSSKKGGPDFFQRNPEMPLVSLREFRNRGEEEYIQHVIKKCEGKISRAADVLGIHRTYLYKLLEQNAAKK